MPETVFACLLDTRRTFDFDQPESAIKLYHAKKVAQLHHWNVDMSNSENTSFISIKIPKSTRQKKRACYKRDYENVCRVYI